MATHNERLEARKTSVRAALMDLATAVDENLRAVHLLLTTEEEVAQGLAFQPTEALAEAVMDRSMEFLGLQSPVATDLRWAMAVIRAGKDYERVQNLAAALLRRVKVLSSTLLAEILHAMTEVTSEVLALHRLILELLGGRVTLAEIQPQLKLRYATIEARLAEVENLAIGAMVEGDEGAENLRELVLATRHLKRISDEMAVIPGEFQRSASA
jgi:phosphate uptake regulator